MGEWLQGNLGITGTQKDSSVGVQIESGAGLPMLSSLIGLGARDQVDRLDGEVGESEEKADEELLHRAKLDIRLSVGNKSGMKKFFSLEAGNHKPARLADKIKSDVRKYLKRERGKELPEGVDFWDFDCRQGENLESAGEIHEKEIGKSITSV